MFLRSLCLMLVALSPLFAQEGKGFEIDFLGSYYDQDGDHSPVNGGQGSEELQSVSPVFVVKYTTDSKWLLNGTFGVDNITSASIDSMDENGLVDHVSSASRLDTRAFTQLGASKQMGDQTWGGSIGFSKEYDYASVSAGLNWSMDFDQKNTTLGLSFNHYADEVTLYDIDGIDRGTDDRTTSDLSLSLTRVLSARALLGVELNTSQQSGFLSSPFQEVILDSGEHVAERLPDSRSRNAIRLSLNYAFSPKLVQRNYVRFYDDDFGIAAQTLELETHIKLPTSRDIWIYPLVRYHTQSAADHYGEPGSFSALDPYFTVDRDLSEFTSTRFGLGMDFKLDGRHFRKAGWRLSSYERDEGLTSINLSFHCRWSF